MYYIIPKLSDSCLLRCPNHGRTAVPAVRAFAPIRTGETPVLHCFVIKIAQFIINYEDVS